MIMKKHLSFQYLIIFLVLSLLVGCKKENVDGPTPGGNDTPGGDVPTSEIPSGNIDTPDWQVSSDYDYSSSMTVIAQVDLTTTYTTLTPNDWQVDNNDLLAAFAGGECIGVTKPIDNLFFLYITSPSQDNEDITLRYYSVQLRNIFQANTVLRFENGARHGSVNEPLKPSFEEFN
jgi:hypothetical protein